MFLRSRHIWRSPTTLISYHSRGGHLLLSRGDTAVTPAFEERALMLRGVWGFENFTLLRWLLLLLTRLMWRETHLVMVNRRDAFLLGMVVHEIIGIGVWEMELLSVSWSGAWLTRKGIYESSSLIMLPYLRRCNSYKLRFRVCSCHLYHSIETRSLQATFTVYLFLSMCNFKLLISRCLLCRGASNFLTKEHWVFIVFLLNFVIFND